MDNSQTRALTLMAGHGAMLTILVQGMLSGEIQPRPLVLEHGINAAPLFMVMNSIGIVVAYIGLRSKTTTFWDFEFLSGGLFAFALALFCGWLLGAY